MTTPCHRTAPEQLGVALKGRRILFTDRPDPYAGNLMGSKLAFVALREVANPDNIYRRYISDTRSEANDRIDNDRLPQCVVPRHQNVVRRALYWKRTYPTIPVLICKRDAKGAFKFTLVSIRDMAYMWRMFSVYISMYLSLLFGWRPSPANWGVISAHLIQYVAAYSPRDEFIDGAGSFSAYRYVGRGALSEPRIGFRPWKAAPLWEHARTSFIGANVIRSKKTRRRGQRRN